MQLIQTESPESDDESDLIGSFVTIGDEVEEELI
jgi:hypothetical protein